jgi:hypothetical protein
MIARMIMMMRTTVPMPIYICVVPSYRVIVLGLATRRRTLKHAARRAGPAERARRLDPGTLVTDYVLSRMPE